DSVAGDRRLRRAPGVLTNVAHWRPSGERVRRENSTKMTKILGLGAIVLTACGMASDFGEAPSDGTRDDTKQAITDGQLDGDAHPAVVLLTMWKDGEYQ